MSFAKRLLYNLNYCCGGVAIVKLQICAYAAASSYMYMNSVSGWWLNELVAFDCHSTRHKQKNCLEHF